MNILIAPLHYVADKNEGSEYTRAYDYIDYLSRQKDMSGVALVGFMEESKIGNFSIKRFFDKKPSYISNLTRIRFIIWIFFEARKAMAKEKFDLIWHNGPFAIDNTFSLLALLAPKYLPFIVGPINKPHTYIGADEARSMGSKNSTISNTRTRLIKFIDTKTYFISEIFRVLSSLTLKKATLVIAREKAVEKIIKKRGVNRVTTLNMAMKITHSLQPNPKNYSGKIRLVNVSYLVERKCTQDLIRMMDYLVNKKGLDTFQLTIVGDGPQKNRLEDMVEKLQLHSFIKFVGYVKKSNVMKYYRKADIFVSASLSDTMPAMYFEAMSSGLPLVTYRNQSTDELIEEGVSCTTVNSRDCEAMAEEIVRLSKSVDSLKKMGLNNSSVYNSKFSFTKLMDRFIELLNTIKMGGGI